MTLERHEVPEDRRRRRRRRGCSAAEVVDFLEYLAPPNLASPTEPGGLQVGAPSAKIRCVVVAAMPTYTALSTAASRRQSLLLTAAPLITQPLSKVRQDDPAGAKIAYLLQHGTNLYVLPNSFASAPGGFDDSLADRLGLAATAPIEAISYEQQFKVAVYSPVAHTQFVLQAAAEAGAGRLGNYTHCSFRTRGRGTFMPREGARPTVGRTDSLEAVDEDRIEMMVPERELQGVIAAVLDAHPYEEVAYDVIPVRNPGTLYGRGRIGDLPLKVSLDTILSQVQDALELDSVRCSHRTSIPIGTLAAASGFSNGLLARATSAGAGAFVTGGAALPDLVHADNSAAVLIDVGYAASLAPGLQRLCAQLAETFRTDALEVVYEQ